MRERVGAQQLRPVSDFGILSLREAFSASSRQRPSRYRDPLTQQHIRDLGNTS
jgi:hypothetical protein